MYLQKNETVIKLIGEKTWPFKMQLFISDGFSATRIRLDEDIIMAGIVYILDWSFSLLALIGDMSYKWLSLIYVHNSKMLPIMTNFLFFEFVFELSCVIIEVQFWVISFVKLVNQIINQHQAILYVLEVDVVVFFVFYGVLRLLLIF